MPVVHEVQWTICFDGKLHGWKRYVKRVLRMVVLQQDFTFQAEAQHSTGNVLQAAVGAIQLVEWSVISVDNEVRCQQNIYLGSKLDQVTT